MYLLNKSKWLQTHVCLFTRINFKNYLLPWPMLHTKKYKLCCILKKSLTSLFSPHHSCNSLNKLLSAVQSRGKCWLCFKHSANEYLFLLVCNFIIFSVSLFFSPISPIKLIISDCPGNISLDFRSFSLLFSSTFYLARLSSPIINAFPLPILFEDVSLLSVIL